MKHIKDSFSLKKTCNLQNTTPYILAHILLVISIVLCFRNGFTHFMAGDDYNLFFDMVKVLHHPQHIFDASAFRRFFRPMQGIYFMLNILLAGAHPFAFHFGAFLIHLANSILLSLWINRIFNNRLTGLLGALLWSLNYKHTEAVFRPYGVADSLALLFCLLTFLFFLQRRTCLACASLVFALFAKENATVFPLIMTLYVWMFIKKNQKEWFARTLPYWGIAFLIAGFGVYHRSDQASYLHLDAGGLVRFWEIMLSYIGPDMMYLKMLWQKGPEPAHIVWVAIALSVIFIIGLWKLPAKYSFPLLFTSIMTLPTVFVSHQTSRYYYIPLVGIAMIAGQGLSSVFTYLLAQNAKKRIALLMGACLLVLIYFILGINIEERDYALMGDLHRQAVESFQQSILPTLLENPEKMVIFLKPDSRPLVEALDKKFRSKPWYVPTTYKWIYVRARGVLGMTNTYAFVTYCAYEQNKDSLFVSLSFDEFQRRILAGEYHIVIHDYTSNSFHFGPEDVKAQLLKDMNDKNVYRNLQPGYFDSTKSGSLDI